MTDEEQHEPVDLALDDTQNPLERILDDHEPPEVARKAQRDRVFRAIFDKPVVSRFGRYVVLGELGKGGMGVVLKGYDDKLDRPVAIKILRADKAGDEGSRLEREAQALAKLTHPNIVQVYEVGEADGQLFVVMEMVKGKPLDEWHAEQEKPRPWKECVEVYLQAGEGLAAAHAKGLVHRDFKPANAILDEEGRVRVLDFGLARKVDGGELLVDGVPSVILKAREGDAKIPLDQSLTQTGLVLGTPAYMPPEQMAGKETDARSDQFSFCVSLYEALYGERPFAGNTLLDLMAALSRGDVEPAPRGSDVPAKLRAVLLRGLAASPEARWPSIESLLSALRKTVHPPARRWVAGVSLAIGMLAIVGIWDAKKGEAVAKKGEADAKEGEADAKEGEAVAKKGEAVAKEGEAVAKEGERRQSILRGMYENALAGRPNRARLLLLELEGGWQEIPGVRQFIHRLSWEPMTTYTMEHDGRVNYALWSPKGQYLATSSDNRVRVWGVNRGQDVDVGEVWSNDTDEIVKSVAWSAVGERLALASGRKAIIWNSPKGDGSETEPDAEIEYDGKVESVSWGPDGDLIALVGDNGGKVVDPGGGRECTIEGELIGASWSKDGNRLATASISGGVQIWNVDVFGPDCQREETLSSDPIEGVSWSPDGEHVIARSALRGILMWRVEGWDAYNVEGLGNVEDVVWAEDGKRFLAVSGRDVYVFDVRQARDLELEPSGSLEGDRRPVVHASWSGTGEQIATASRDGLVRVWEAKTQELQATYRGHAGTVSYISWEPGGKRIATASDDGTARLWGDRLGVEVFSDEDGEVREIDWKGGGRCDGNANRPSLDESAGAIWSYDCTQFITVSDGKAKVWRDGALVDELECDEEVNIAKWSMEGDWIATASEDGVVRVWHDDGAGWTTNEPLLNEGKRILDVAWSQTGMLAAAGIDRKLRIWNSASPAEVKEAVGHAGAVRSVSWDKEGKQIVTGSEDGTVRIWDVDADPLMLTERIVLEGHEESVEYVLWGPKGDRHWVASRSKDDTVRYWRVDTEEIYEVLEQEALDRLSDAERAEYLLDSK